MHLWRIAFNLLPTKDSLARFNPLLDPLYSLCSVGMESAIHLFWDCPLARSLWFGSSLGIKTDIMPITSIVELLDMLLAPLVAFRLDCDVKERWTLDRALILDQIWRLRNGAIFEGKVKDMDKVCLDLALRGNKHWTCRKSTSSQPSPLPVCNWKIGRASCRERV